MITLESRFICTSDFIIIAASICRIWIAHRVNLQDFQDFQLNSVKWCLSAEHFRCHLHTDTFFFRASWRAFVVTAPSSMQKMYFCRWDPSHVIIMMSLLLLLPVHATNIPRFYCQPFFLTYWEKHSNLKICSNKLKSVRNTNSTNLCTIKLCLLYILSCPLNDNVLSLLCYTAALSLATIHVNYLNNRFRCRFANVSLFHQRVISAPDWGRKKRNIHEFPLWLYINVTLNIVTG